MGVEDALNGSVIRMCEEAVVVLKSASWGRRHASAYKLLSTGVEYLIYADVQIPAGVFQEYADQSQRRKRNV